eukprot:scaffold7368_cov114-Skeletonema_marinoi.AAC.1
MLDVTLSKAIACKLLCAAIRNREVRVWMGGKGHVLLSPLLDVIPVFVEHGISFSELSATFRSVMIDHFHPLLHDAKLCTCHQSEASAAARTGIVGKPQRCCTYL